MRYRTTILFLLACVLALYPALQTNQQQAICANADATGDSGSLLSLISGDISGCAHGASQTERLLQLLAGLCALGGCISAGKAWRERQQDRALLRGALRPE